MMTLKINQHQLPVHVFCDTCHLCCGQLTVAVKVVQATVNPLHLLSNSSVAIRTVCEGRHCAIFFSLPGRWFIWTPWTPSLQVCCGDSQKNLLWKTVHSHGHIYLLPAHWCCVTTAKQSTVGGCTCFEYFCLYSGYSIPMQAILVDMVNCRVVNVLSCEINPLYGIHSLVQDFWGKW